MRDEPIDLVPYDPTWLRKFEEERARLTQVLAPWLAGPIEHIGSTAIPGLIAKPVIAQLPSGKLLIAVDAGSPKPSDRGRIIELSPR